MAVVGLLTRHLAITLVQQHGEEGARALLQRIILDADEARRWTTTENPPRCPLRGA